MLLIGESRQRNCSGISRRGLIQAGFLGALGMTAPQHAVLAATARRPKAVILVWLWGGPPHLDTVDPKPEAPSEWRGPYRAIGTNVPGIQVTELLPRLARRADRYAILRSLHRGTNDHGLAGTIGMTGRTPAAGQVHPHMGAIVNRIRGFQPTLSTFVTVGEPMEQGHRRILGEGGGVLGSVYDPFRVKYDPELGVLLGDTDRPEGITEARVDRRKRLLRDAASAGSISNRETLAFDRFYDQAFSLMTDSDGRKVFDLGRESARMRDSYGRHRFGQSCLLARRLVEHGVPFVQVNWSQHVESEEDAGDGGWDNHYRNFEMLAERQCLPFDQAFSALLDDLRERGMFEDTLVVAMGEFGRTPKINPQSGRDHWQNCYSAIVAGGGVRGGQAIGASDDRGEYPASRPITPADVCSTMLESIGITRTDVLALGLPVEGEVIQELF
ncbi:MAG: phosphoglycerol transferase family protein alkaline phosphatase superfamily [Armatimonadetes bacterium]|nr:phosphoglycerol transferase family protein alkaline phosphatase superfamily [Armatimonadota bacterium]